MGCSEHSRVFSLPLILGRNLGIKDQELIIPLKAGSTACLSLQLFSIPPQVKVSWQEEGDELIPNIELIFFLSLMSSKYILFYTTSPGDLEWMPLAKLMEKIIKLWHRLE